MRQSRTLSPWGPERGGSTPAHCCTTPRRVRTATGSSGALHTPPPPLHRMWASSQGVPRGPSGDLPALSTGIRFSRRGGRCPQGSSHSHHPSFCRQLRPPPPQFNPLSFLRSGPCHSSFQDREKHARCYGGLGEQVAREDSILKE